MKETTGRGRVARALCFLVPCLLLGAAFGAQGIYPFGDKSLLVIDMNSEYVEYLAHLYRVSRGEGSLLRSWNMGMGLNMLGLVAFYISSPCNLILLLFPPERLTEALLAVTLLKAGLCGLLFSFYARRIAPALPWAATLLFSVAYALMGYNTAYSSNVMWLDGVAFLPLVLLGVEEVIRRGRRAPLAAALAYVFFSSYYIGYMIGGFSLLYLLARMLSGNLGWRQAGRRLGVFFGAAGLAAGLCAFLLLPAFCNLRDGQEALFQLNASPALQRPLLEPLARLLPGVYDTLTDSGAPNVYCTVAAAGLCGLYFGNRSISRREKLLYGGLLALLLVSFSSGFLYLGWHAFEDPTWFPARFSFLFSFWILFLAMRAASRPEGLRPRTLWMGLAAGGVLLAAIGAAGYSFVGRSSLALGGLLGVLYLLVGWRALLLPEAGRACWLAALLLVCGESFCSARAVIQGIDGQFGYKSREGYWSYRTEYGAALEELPGGVYRVEIAEPRNSNGGLALGYPSVSHYSTTTDQSLNRFLKGMGYNTGTINELRFAPNTPLANGILGIRYLLAREPLPGYEEEGGGRVRAYRNPAAFPLAFVADSRAGEWNVPPENDPFALQNGLLSALWGGQVAPYQRVEAVETLVGATREDREDYLLYTAQGEKAVIRWEIPNPEGKEVYAFLPVYGRLYADARAYGNGSVDGVRELGYRNNTVLSLGSGETALLELELRSEHARIEDLLFYTLDLEEAAALAERAREQEMDFSLFADTRVQGTVSAPGEGTLVTTFPLDKGWAVSVDGVKVETGSFAGVFLAVPLEEGTHTVAMSYRPAGFLAGCLVSGGCWLAVGLYYGAGWLRKKRKSGGQEVPKVL